MRRIHKTRAIRTNDEKGAAYNFQTIQNAGKGVASILSATREAALDRFTGEVETAVFPYGKTSRFARVYRSPRLGFIVSTSFLHEGAEHDHGCRAFKSAADAFRYAARYIRGTL